MQQNRHQTILTKASNKMNLIPNTKRLTPNIIKKVPNIINEGPQWVFRDTGFPLFEAGDSGFYSKIREGFGIESIRGRWDAKNNPRNYGIARNLGSGLRDRKTLLGTLIN